ncbi:MAG: transposase [Chitinophagaceae bacterium]|nr:transposase [Chitinophagaceae bacterium]
MYYNPLFLQTPSILEDAFYQTDLGRLHSSIPFKELAAKIPSPPHNNSGLGRKPFLKVEGGIALLILKHYTGLSDEMLIDRLNTDWCMQYFCGVQLNARRIKDKNLVSWWRCYLARHLDIKEMQSVVISSWKPYMEQTHVTMMDATVYESNIRYPTDAKLLWEGIEKVYQIIQAKRKLLKLRSSRSNYHKHKSNYLSYQRNRRKSKRKDKKLRKQLLKYLHRLLEGLQDLQTSHKLKLSNKEKKLISSIKTIYNQQHELLYGNRENVKHRIVSLHKPHIRPIIRGKEVKPVEFGAKVHKVQVGGLSFIEHLSYDNFNESTRLKQSIAFHQKHFGKCSQLAADAIYATNENRRYCTSRDIATSFLPKGKQGKLQEQKSAMRSALSTVRATVLEGSFGNEKNHYLLGKIKAKTQATEIAWIFFGMLTANASIISKRIHLHKQLRRTG